MANKQEGYNREYAAILEERSIRDHENYINNITKRYKQLIEKNERLSEKNERLNEKNKQLIEENKENTKCLVNIIYYLKNNCNMSLDAIFDCLSISQNSRGTYLKYMENEKVLR